MANIYLSTIIKAPQERVFDLARSVDAHQQLAKTGDWQQYLALPKKRLESSTIGE